MSERQIGVIFCAPLSLFPEQPKDYSKSELIDCPTCNKKMWFSEKKKEWKGYCEFLGREMIIECFICFEQRVKNEPEIMKDHVRIDI